MTATSHFDTLTTSARPAGASSDHGTRAHGSTDRTRRPHGLGLRLRTGLHHRRLDHELANGLPAASSPERALHAAQLADPRSRAVLGRSLRRLATDAQARRRTLRPQVAPARAALLAHEARVLALADRIDGDATVAVAGLARTRLLLADGSGPLYSRSARQSLGAELRAIDDALDTH